MKILALLAIIAWINCAELTRDLDAPNAVKPILVELFTSEGCSSCPPADTWLQKLDSTQPIAGAQAIVLSEHVDYWNHDGWKDPYSSQLFTERQNGYVRALGLNSPYTPQVIVDGTSVLKLSDSQQVNQVLLNAVKAPQVPVTINAMTVDGSAPAVLRAHIEVDGTSQKRNAEIYAVLALDHAESRVLHGENGGRRLMHVAVAQELIKVGKLEKGSTFSKEFQANLKPGIDPGNLRLVVFVQEPNLGGVLGAALHESSPARQ
jgi:hypothetical protein